MIFKRRDPKPTLRAVAEFLWPRGGWTRAFHYVRHRMRRLPDTPERIARGIWAGVFTAFSPFYGIHFFIAGFLAWLMRGNVLAALMGTFFGNPLTYVPIGLAAMGSGHWILGSSFDRNERAQFGHRFAEAGRDMWHNFKAIFTSQTTEWQGIFAFYDDIFYPYLIGGILPGIICATICYYLMVPILYAYQKRRRGMIKAKFEALKAKAAAKTEGKAIKLKKSKKEQTNGG